MPGFNNTKHYKIAECNRDFVWSLALKEGFVRSVLNNEPLPALVMCNNELIDGGNRATTLWLYHNNKFKVDNLKYDDLTFEQQAMWRQCMMPVTMIEGATANEKADYYEKFNQGVVLTFGQKMENRKNRPLVAASFSFIGHHPDESPLQDLVRRVWSPALKNSRIRSEVTFAYKVITASMLGGAHFYPSWANASVYIAETEEVDLERLRDIMTVISDVDPDRLVDPKRKKLCFEKFIGAVIHDSWSMYIHGVHTEPFIEKWPQFFRAAYDVLSPNQIKSLFSYKPVGVAAGMPNRGEAISRNVNAYLAGTFQFNANIEEDEED